MTRPEMLKELDRIIDVGIVNAHHDKDVLMAVREQLQESDLNAIKRILSGCSHMKDHWALMQEENAKGETVHDVVIKDVSGSIILCFDAEGRLYA